MHDCRAITREPVRRVSRRRPRRPPMTTDACRRRGHCGSVPVCALAGASHEVFDPCRPVRAGRAARRTFRDGGEIRLARASAGEAPPLEKLPDWAVPQSYKLDLRSDPEQPGYSGTVAIAVDLKQASDHLWLHGKDLKVSSVTITDANGKSHGGKY